MISKLYIIQGTNTTNEIIIGNKTVQQKDINWSNLILGKDALVHMKMKIIIHDLTPKVKPYNNPSTIVPENMLSLCKLFI